MKRGNWQVLVSYCLNVDARISKERLIELLQEESPMDISKSIYEVSTERWDIYPIVKEQEDS